MSKITSVSLSNSQPKYFEVPMEVWSDSTGLADLVQVQFLGAVQEKHPTQYVVAINMAKGLMTKKPAVDTRDASQVKLSISGNRLDESRTTVFGIIDSEDSDALHFAIVVNVNATSVTYKFKKKRGR